MGPWPPLVGRRRQGVEEAAGKITVHSAGHTHNHLSDWVHQTGRDGTGYFSCPENNF